MAALLLSVGPAAAQTVVLPGEVGNEGGCARARSGNAVTDDAILLRSSEIQQHESFCEFLDVKQSRAGPQVVRSLCSGEGSFWLMDFVVVDVGGGNFVLNFGHERPEVVVGPCG